MVAAALKCLFNHTYRLLLMAKCGETTEGHVIGPVEASEVLRVLHALGPVRLRFEILGDLPALLLILRLGRLLVLHQCAIKHVHFEGLLLFLSLHLLDKMVEFFGRGLADKVLSFGRVADGVVVGDRLGANVLIEVAFWHDGLRANR